MLNKTAPGRPSFTKGSFKNPQSQDTERSENEPKSRLEEDKVAERDPIPNSNVNKTDDEKTEDTQVKKDKTIPAIQIDVKNLTGATNGVTTSKTPGNRI